MEELFPMIDMHPVADTITHDEVAVWNITKVWRARELELHALASTSTSA
jgi:hypothetical protein